MAQKFANPFEITDFTGGITDDVYLQEYKSSATIDNLDITSDKKLYTRIGSVNDVTTSDAQVPAGVSRIGALINYYNSDALFVQSGTHIYYRNPSAYTTFTGPSGNQVFSGGGTTNAISFSEWNKQVFVTTDAFPRPMKLYKDSGGVYRVRTSGMPALGNAPTCTPTAGANSYVYAFYYSYTYTVGDQTFEDVGPITQVSVTAAAAPNISTIAITVIPVVANGGTDNWDTAVMKVKIYRTVNAGQVLYHVADVTNGTTTYNDTSSDATIQTAVTIYTNDGTLGFDPAPSAKFVHVVNNTAFYGFIKDSGVQYPFRIRQSIPGAPSAAPASLYIDVEDEVAGLSSVASIPIVLCKRRIYRLENTFDQFGRGGINFVRISDTAGCISNLSIVQAEGMIYWAGNDGFYASDGYKVMKISDNINATYKTTRDAQSQTNRIYGKFDETERRILWGIQSDSSSLDNDACIVLDLRWGITDNSTFYTWSGTTFSATALENFNKKIYRGDKSGYVYIHDRAYLTDPRVDTGAAVANWSEETIIWTYKSININFGSTFMRKMPTRILLTAANQGNNTIQISAINDDGRLVRDCKPIRIRSNFIWGDLDFVWGNPDCVWDQLGLIEQWRRFPARGLRTSYIQIVITNGLGVITDSDIKGTATFSNTLKTVTLDDPSGEDWPDNAADYYIRTEADNYTEKYLITNRTADVLTVADPNVTLPPGSLQWDIVGYVKGELLNLLSYNIHWTEVSQSQRTYHAGDLGGNS